MNALAKLMRGETPPNLSSRLAGSVATAAIHTMAPAVATKPATTVITKPSTTLALGKQCNPAAGPTGCCDANGRLGLELGLD